MRVEHSDDARSLDLYPTPNATRYSPVASDSDTWNLFSKSLVKNRFINPYFANTKIFHCLRGDGPFSMKLEC